MNRFSTNGLKRISALGSPERALWIAFLGFLIVSPAYLLCRLNHFCMGGHLPDHRDLEHTHSTVLGYALDSIWVGGFALSVLMAFRSGITFRYAFIFALGVALLVVTNPVGLGDILGWPVHAALCLFALACLKGWID